MLPARFVGRGVRMGALHFAGSGAIADVTLPKVSLISWKEK